MLIDRIASRVPERFRTERGVRQLVLLMIVGGILLRLLWAWRGDHFEPFGGESQNIAVALATKGSFADAYYPGGGPTAHVSWTTPLPAALVYSILGPASPASEFTLTLIALALVGLGIYLLNRCMEELGAPVLARLAGVAVAAIFPFQFALEVVEFRTWEAGIATAAAAAILLAILKSDRLPALPWRRMLLLAVACGLLGVLSAAPGLACSGALGVLLIRRAPPLRWPFAVATVIGTALLVSAPWAIRNQQVMGEWILTRSTLGLQKAMTYHDGALDAEDPGKAYQDRHEDIMPVHKQAYARLQAAGGEIAYVRLMDAQASAWIERHRAELPRIWLGNLRDYYFPPQRFFNRFGAKATAVGPRQTLLIVLTALGLLTIVAMLALRNWRYFYVAAIVALSSAPYVLTYPLMRYRYVISTLLILLAFDGLFRLASWALGKKASRSGELAGA